MPAHCSWAPLKSISLLTKWPKSICNGNACWAFNQCLFCRWKQYYWTDWNINWVAIHRTWRGFLHSNPSKPSCHHANRNNNWKYCLVPPKLLSQYYLHRYLQNSCVRRLAKRRNSSPVKSHFNSFFKKAALSAAFSIFDAYLFLYAKNSS